MVLHETILEEYTGFKEPVNANVQPSAAHGLRWENHIGEPYRERTI